MLSEDILDVQERNKRCIIVKTCESCPYILHDDGGGHCSTFVKCTKFNIMLFDWDGPESFNYDDFIHPDCKLKNIQEIKG